MAYRLGISPDTLRSWESGKRLPPGPPLARLLDALEVAPRLRAELVAGADPRHARRALIEFPAGPPIELGTILRALRLRRGLTQAEAARTIGVAQSTVAQWEAGDRLPEEGALHAVLVALDAKLAEAEAVLARPSVARPPVGEPHETRDAIDRLPNPLREVALLTNERALWWRAVRDPRWEDALRRAIAQRAVWYGLNHRMGEVDALLRQVRRMTPDPSVDPPSAGVALVFADVRFRPLASPMSLFHRLDAHVVALAPSPERAWAMGTQAVALATAGERRAVDLARDAVREVERWGFAPVEGWNRRIDLAEVHLRLGEPERVLEATDDLFAEGRVPSMGFSVRAQALIALRREPQSDLMAALRDHAAGTPFHESRLASIERALPDLRL